MNDSYHKARKSYCLFSAILIAWELIGIELTATPLESFKVTFKTPQAAPLVLLVLVFYFAYKFIIEWLLIENVERNKLPAKFDYYVTHCIAVIAIAIYLIQTIIEKQIYSLLATSEYNFILIGFLSILLYGTKVLSKATKYNYKNLIRLYLGVPIAGIVPTTFIFVLKDKVNLLYAFLFVCIGIVAALIICFPIFIWKLREQRKQPAEL